MVSCFYPDTYSFQRLVLSQVLILANRMSTYEHLLVSEYKLSAFVVFGAAALRQLALLEMATWITQVTFCCGMMDMEVASALRGHRWWALSYYRANGRESCEKASIVTHCNHQGQGGHTLTSFSFFWGFCLSLLFFTLSFLFFSFHLFYPWFISPTSEACTYYNHNTKPLTLHLRFYVIVWLLHFHYS